MFRRISVFLLVCLLPLTGLASDALKVSHAWAGATVPGQPVGAAYMVLQSATDASLIEVVSPAAGSIEIHKMSMNDGVMEMDMLETLALPAGKAVKLEPGGFHLMLFELKKPLKAGEEIVLTLKLKIEGGKTRTQEVRVPIRKIGDQ